MKPLLRISLIAFAVAALSLGLLLSGCKTPTLEPGGAYAPTNAVGQVVYNDVGLALADASYKFSYETVVGLLKFERDHRAEIWAISPGVKHGLDQLRPKIQEINYRWALARRAYRQNPTPAGLGTLQGLLGELQRLVSVTQSQLSTVGQQLGQPY